MAAALLLAGCGGGEPAPAEPAAGGAGFPRTVDHAMGRTTIEAQPKKVAALDATYVGAAMALETEVVAFTKFSAYGDALPPYLGEDAKRFGAAAKPIGALETPNVEQLHDIAPDLIISAKVRHEKLYNELTGVAPTVFSETTGATWKDNLRLLGRALGKEELAERRLAAYAERARAVGEAVKAKLGRPATASLVRFVEGEPTLRLYTSNSFPGIVLADAGLTRPQGQPDLPDKISVNLSQEDIGKVDADQIFVSTWTDPDEQGVDVKAQFQANPLWGTLKGKRTEVEDGVWVGSVSLHGAHAMLDQIAQHFGVPVPPRG
ncbi:iron-siderophore ABC transporter substrate-binding protein [Amycolatopsis suaedae]|uniref:Iron-siderophore ABC transporter substrate-binding protein n=1 Tax=Amycolatopsis suaedae TaxID=2510978 RepID=A0A4Q7JDH8_9PSEU|nr:iron-siderophore ABC transporter substrate-binding protein [Amycolatopsis suaedae]